MSLKIRSNELDIRRFSAEQACHFAEVIFENAAGARSGEDVERLHDMRVGSRRLRETFQLFGMFYRPSKLKKILKQLKTLTRILGLPREMDVNLDLLQEFKCESDPQVPIAHEHLLETFERRQAKVRRRMDRAFDALNLKKLRAEWINFAQTSMLAPKPQSILGGIQREFESEAYLKQTTAILKQKAIPIQAYRAGPLQSESDESLHRLRIVLKKFRYALEIYDPLFGHRFEKAIQSTKELQEVLGKIHDYSVLIQQLQSHHIHLQAKNHLKLAGGCGYVIEFFKGEKNALYPLLEPSYAAMIQELNSLLTPPVPVQFPGTRKRRGAVSRRPSATIPLSSDTDVNTG
jgi:CHAD domain-containing protein